MKRRDFLAAAGVAFCASRSALSGVAPFIETVRGPLPLEDLGVTLIHEHVMVDFIGADTITPGRYQADEVFAVALPYLKRAHDHGCRTLVECTPAYLGRDPGLMRRLSRASDLQIVTNTGYYGASENRFVPAHAFREGAKEIAQRWVDEHKNGIDDSAIRPGLIKIGVDKGPLSEMGRRLAQAAAIAHQQTGLTVASHTGNGPAALEQLDIFMSEGVSPAAFIWVHAQSEEHFSFCLKAAGRGAWVEFDGISDDSILRHVVLVKGMIDRGFLRQTLISMDAGWYHVGEPGGGTYRGYDSLFSGFLPALRKAGASEKQIKSLLIDNPRQALRTGVRPL